LIQIIDRAIEPHEVLNDLKANDSGSLVMHIGIVRPSSEGKKVTSVEYQIEKEEAARELLQITGDIKSKWQIQDIALLRRMGKLVLGEIILIAAIAAPHRKDAFEACQYAIERLRGMTSVQKRENYE
jgi:molybdopterin synthase catalytic subunit